MPAGEFVVEVSMTEVPHFERLVQFLEDAEAHAREVDDYTLLSLVDECRDELAGLWR